MFMFRPVMRTQEASWLVPADCDRWLWGQNKQEALLNELAKVG